VVTSSHRCSCSQSTRPPRPGNRVSWRYCYTRFHRYHMIIYGGVAEFNRTVFGSVSYEQATTTSETGLRRLWEKCPPVHSLLEFYPYAYEGSLHGEILQ
jgi:hypothetical protein